MEKKLENVWNRREEANHSYRDAETFELKEGYHFGKVKKICKEEGVTIEEFMKYAQDRAKNEVEQLDEYSIRYTNKFGLGCTLVVYAGTMAEARQKASEELGDYLVRINEIRNVSLARQLINEVE